MRAIGLGTAQITTRGKRYVNQVLESGRITYGPFSEKFERDFAKIHQSKFGIVSNSGTSSLQVALHAMKLHYKWKDGDEVIVPATTFVASINVILQNGLTPKLVDIDPVYFSLDPVALEKAITKKTRAVMVVHLFGHASPMTALMPIIQKHKLHCIEDSCETMFARHGDKMVGSWGDVGVFSTYTAHLITTGVGGIAITNNNELAVLMKSLCNHGRDRVYLSIDDDDKVRSKQFSFILSKRFRFKHVGYSYRITEMEAALGLAQLEEYKKIIEPRKKNAAYLTKLLSDLTDTFQLPSIHPQSDHVFMVYPFVVRDSRIRLPHFLLYLERHGIETRYLVPLINQPAYNFLHIQRQDYPVSQTLLKTGFYIGCHQHLTNDDMEYVSDAFHSYVKKI